MFIKSTIIGLFAFVAQQAVAQNATAQQVAIVEANFEQAGLVPSFLPTFSPEGVLNVAFGGSQITVGQAFAPSAVSSFPSISVSPLPESEEIGMGEGYRYTAMMVDADIVGTNEDSTNQTFHWLANNVGIATGGALDLSTATTVINYVGPGPAAGSGTHRYVILLVRQENTFQAPAGVTTFGAYSTSQYLDNDGLGSIVAANYIGVEDGTATAAISSTSAVNTATVSASSMMTSAAASSAASGTSRASGISSAAASAASSAASSVRSAVASAAPTTGAAVKVGGSLALFGVTLIGAAMGALML